MGLGLSGPSYSLEDNRAGFTAGAGIEYAFWGNWSAKVEYDFMDFGTKNLAFRAITNIPLHLNQFADDRERLHVIKAGMNYRFWWGKAPVVAKY